MNAMDILTKEQKDDLIRFTQDLIRIKSYSGQEEEIVKFIEQKMKALGYDEVIIDSMGNVLGRIGSGEKSILFDSHVDTVMVNDEELWDVPPFSGQIEDGRLYGRGSVDMKSGAAASIFAGAIAKQHRITILTGPSTFHVAYLRKIVMGKTSSIYLKN